MKCKTDYKFVVAGETIEIRKKDGSYDPDDKSCVSICCPECLPDLEEAILELKKKIGKPVSDLDKIIDALKQQQKVNDKLMEAIFSIGAFNAIMPSVTSILKEATTKGNWTKVLKNKEKKKDGKN